jgi:Ca2+-binding RTX toxin-like protein
MATAWTLTKFSFSFLPGYENSDFIEFPIDVNGDGRPDLVVVPFLADKSGHSEPIKILLNDGHGHFHDATSSFFPAGAPTIVGPSLQSVVADFNGDGRPDLFIADEGIDALPNPGGQNLLLLSSGPHGFIDATNRLPQLKDATNNATAADITGNGTMDIFVQNFIGPQIGTPPGDPSLRPYFLMNDGTGHFTPDYTRLPPSIENGTPGSHESALFFDANGDHHPDLLLGSAGLNSSTVLLLNDGTGNFSNASPVTLPLPNGLSQNAVLTAAAAADLNGDGALDLVLAYEDPGPPGSGGPLTQRLQILMNDGHGNFTDQTTQRLPSFTFTGTPAIQLVDINGDGYPDIVPRAGSAAGPILMNDGTGHFVALPLTFPGRPFPGSPANDLGGSWRTTVFDANGDGHMDILFEHPTAPFGNPPHGWLKGSFDLFTWHDPGRVQTSTLRHDVLFGDNRNDTISGLGGHDIIFGGRGNDKLYAKGGNNYLNGGRGNDTIDGGPGHNTLFGGPGADHFVFDSPVNGRNVNTIVDFAPRDKIVLSETDFHGIGAIGHRLAASHFTIGADATTHAQRIIYNPDNGFLYYDRDGSGRHPEVHFATITANLDLHNADFLVAA